MRSSHDLKWENKQVTLTINEVISPPNERKGTGAEICPAIVSGIVIGDALRVSCWTRCGSAIGHAAGQLMDALRVSCWTRCRSAIGRAAGQLLPNFFSLSQVTSREVVA